MGEGYGDSNLGLRNFFFARKSEDNAFFICDVRDLENKVKLWRRELPRVTPFFGE